MDLNKTDTVKTTIDTTHTNDVPVDHYTELENRCEKICSFSEEMINNNKLPELLQHHETKQTKPVAYDGFEPSGRIHIAQGIIRTINTNKLTDSGCEFIFWVADWFAKLNNKMGGDLKKIQTAGKLMIETWKLCGMNMENVKFLWASEEINTRANEYWSLVMDIASVNSLSRVQRCCKIMGRRDDDELNASQIFYPCMQCADIFFLNVDICSLGVDQRKVNMLAIEYCDKIKRKHKPVVLSHHMIIGLDGTKMSKSNPENAIFMDDAPSDIKRKIKKAYCPPKIVENNPILEYFKYIIFEHPDIKNNVTIQRKEEHGGNIMFSNYELLELSYVNEELYPGDIKNNLVGYINTLLFPIQKALTEDKEFKELTKRVKSYNN
jgi:tyrosyl-tRNA synthetase